MLLEPASCGHDVAGEHDGDRSALRRSGRGGWEQARVCGDGESESEGVRQPGRDSRFEAQETAPTVSAFSQEPNGPTRVAYVKGAKVGGCAWRSELRKVN